MMMRFSLKALLTCLSMILVGCSVYSQRVFMTGDSHVNGKIYPQTVEEVLQTQYPDLDFSYWGKNGICFKNFNREPEYFDTITSFNPDILIVHLGTNGAYTDKFKPEEFRSELESFYATVKEAMPDVKVVFVTPFDNRLKKPNGKRGGEVNPSNRLASDVIVEFTKETPGTYVIDNNASVGMRYLDDPNLIKDDKVHLTVDGYRVLGTEVGEELLEIKEIWE